MIINLTARLEKERKERKNWSCGSQYMHQLAVWGTVHQPRWAGRSGLRLVLAQMQSYNCQLFPVAAFGSKSGWCPQAMDSTKKVQATDYSTMTVHKQHI